MQELGAARIGAIKVDVEGFEAHVFLGATATLAKDAPLIAFEFCDWGGRNVPSGTNGMGANRYSWIRGYSLWPLPAYRRKSSPLAEPVTVGCHTIIARKRSGPGPQ